MVAVENNTKRYTSVFGSRPRIDQHSDTSMINRDDPEHQDQRRLVARQFTPRAVKQIEDRIRAVVTELIDAVIADGECEAIMDLASPLPAILIGEKLGYPHELWPKLREWSEITMYESARTTPDGSEAPRSAAATRRSRSSRWRRWSWSPSDAPSRRTTSSPPGSTRTCTASRWTDGEIISEALLLLDGGAETTRTVIGAIVRELALHPDQRQLLVDDPAMLGETAVEEFIRWVTPILNMRRTATEDHELRGQQLAGRRRAPADVRLGQPRRTCLRRSRRFDVTRGHNHHVAFGFGTHFCLGASLARIEIRVMFEELLRRIPDWRLAPGTEPKILPATFARAYDEVRIEFTPSTA